MLSLVLVTVALIVFDLTRTEQAVRTRGEAASSAPTPTVSQPGAGSAAPAAAGAEQAPTATPSPTSVTRVPRRGTGVFAVAPGGTGVRAAVPGGTLMRYRVEVEGGSGQDPAGFAAAVDATLADPRSWTATGRWAFQRVTTGPVDAVIKLATPDTTDRICRAGGLDPQGYTSCRTGNQVVVNLARWLLAVPEFRGDLTTYRQYVVNHEVGHRLGQGHVGCPGAGQPAPVMQQQTLGLSGCRPNPWPYLNGRLWTGPPVSGG